MDFLSAGVLDSGFFGGRGVNSNGKKMLVVL